MSGSLQLLLVEDSATDAALVVIEIRRAGHSVEFERVDDVTTMRAALAAKDWDAIIADWSLPRFSALAALRVVKEHRLDVPFIIVSGSVGDEPAVEAMRSGAHDYVLKDRLGRLPPVLEREIREAKMRAAHRLSKITERRAVEVRRRESERQVRQLVENLPDLAWSARPDGHVDFYNRPWYEYTGSTFEEMEGWGWKAVHSPELVEATVESWIRFLSTGEPFEMEFPLRRADGTFRWFLTRVRPLRDAEGRIARWFGTSTDIDEARRARAEREQLVAELRQAVELRDEFLSIASHELRTPLTALQLQLQGTTHLVERLDSPSNARFLGKLEVARRQANRLATLVDGLLDVSEGGAARPLQQSSGCRSNHMTDSTRSGILVVDDDDDIRDTIIECFCDEGYQVSGARHGKDALEQLRNGSPLPCVILLDMMMPVMNGRDFRAEQLLDPRLCDIPVVVVTANANLHELETELKTSGALRKPVSLKQLFKVAELHCGTPESQRSAEN